MNRTISRPACPPAQEDIRARAVLAVMLGLAKSHRGRDLLYALARVWPDLSFRDFLAARRLHEREISRRLH